MTHNKTHAARPAGYQSNFLSNILQKSSVKEVIEVVMVISRVTRTVWNLFWNFFIIDCFHRDLHITRHFDLRCHGVFEDLVTRTVLWKQGALGSQLQNHVKSRDTKGDDENHSNNDSSNGGPSHVISNIRFRSRRGFRWLVARICKYTHSPCSSIIVQATLLNPDMCNPDFRLNRTDWKFPVPSYTYDSYTNNPDFA